MNLPEIDEPVIPDGTRNLRFRDRLFHSRYDPERELLRFIDTAFTPIPDRATVLLIGAGALFEMLQPVADRLDLFLYEPLRDLRSRYHRLDPPLHLIEPDAADTHRFAHILALPVYRRLFPELIGQLEILFGGTVTDRSAASSPKPESVTRYLHRKIADHSAAPSALDEKTQGHFLRLWMRNYRLRLDSAGIHYFEALAPVPDTLLFCGAGPNLVNDLRNLAETAGGVNPPGWFVSAADAAAPAVLAAGWKLDLILSIDSGPGTAYHLGLIPRSMRERIPVLTWLPGSPFLERAGFHPIFVPTLFPPDQILASVLRMPEAWTNPFRNVLGYAFALETRCGIRTLKLAGCGFEISRGTYYTRGTGYSLYQGLKNSRLCSLEDQDIRLTIQQSKANRGTARLLDKKIQTPATAERGSSGSVPSPPLTPHPPSSFQSSFQVRSVFFQGSRLRSVLSLQDLPLRLKSEYGNEWEKLALRHLDFRD